MEKQTDMKMEDLGFKEAAKKFLAKGVDEQIILECTGISIDELEKIKRKL